MNLEEFLKEANGKKSDIINYSGAEALAAVKQYGDALRYVNKSIFDDNEDIITLNGKKYKEIK